MIQSFGLSSLPILLRGALWTLALSGLTFVIGGILGLVFALLNQVTVRHR